MATERNFHKSIAMLQDDSGNEVTDHEAMPGLLWSSYKERMGKLDGITMQFDLASLLERVDGLDDLSIPLDKEMYDVIKAMPSDRAPGPNGFNGIFLKRCWPIIQTEFYTLAADFHAGSLRLENINGSCITLVPKKLSPLIVNHFHPISLTHVCLKFLTKLAADRLQGKILSCLHKN
jgi:hypothetical protein